MLVDIVVEGREAIALADSGSQVNIVTPVYVKHHEFPILPLEELVDHPVNLFQTQILKCKVKPLLRETTLVMVCPIRVGETQLAGTCQLHPGLLVLHLLTRLKMGSDKVSVVVCNMLDSPIYLQKGMRIARMESTLPVPPAELSPEVQAALGKEIQLEPLSVTA